MEAREEVDEDGNTLVVMVKQPRERSPRAGFLLLCHFEEHGTLRFNRQPKRFSTHSAGSCGVLTSYMVLMNSFETTPSAGQARR